jgi:hypothetical protein
MSHPGPKARRLLLASRTLPSARQLAATATDRNWTVHVLDDSVPPPFRGPRTFYGGTDHARKFAQRYELCLIEPPLDLLARLPPEFLGRKVRFGTLDALASLAGPVFVKPADPIHKIFDAGIYAQLSDIQLRANVPPQTCLLAAQPVEWSSEFRCFVCERRIAAWSPYLSFGTPVWKPGCAGPVPPSLSAVCQRLLDRMGDELPPAFVVDIGVLEDGHWVVVEFNPAWCSGILGADVRGVLSVIARAALWRPEAAAGDLRWSRLG